MCRVSLDECDRLKREATMKQDIAASRFKADREAMLLKLEADLAAIQLHSDELLKAKDVEATTRILELETELKLTTEVLTEQLERFVEHKFHKCRQFSQKYQQLEHLFRHIIITHII